nr:MAG TPA: Transcription elongation factor Elf1 like [Caudoviricetes sp.]
MTDVTAVNLQHPIAVCPVCNHGGYEILSIKYKDGEEYVEVAVNDGERQIVQGFRKVSYTTSGRTFFKMFGLRHYLDQFIKL